MINKQFLLIVLFLASIYAKYLNYAETYNNIYYKINLQKNEDFRWFENQKQDHFNPLNKNIWKNKYVVNSKYYEKDGPVFFYFNGEYPLKREYIEIGEIVVLAKQNKGMIVSLENRYFGESIPVSDLSTFNLRFHTIPQFLADAAYFQEWFIETNPFLNSTKWIVVGGSLSGATAAYYRIKYPNLVIASYSSSGVVNPIYNLLGYYKTVETDFYQVKGCHEAVLNVFNEIYILLNFGKYGANKIKNAFNICESGYDILANPNDFYFSVSSLIAGAAQYGYQKGFCNRLMSSGEHFSYFQNLGKMFSEGYPASENGCQSLNWKKANQNISFPKAPNSDRSFFWLKCTAFGFFKTIDNWYWLPKLPIDYLNACYEVFGIDIKPDIQWLKELYGGDKPVGDHMLFVGGTNDPYKWADVKPLNDTSKPLQPHLLIYEGSHCSDLLPAKPTDSKYVVETRKEIERIIKKWLF